MFNTKSGTLIIDDELVDSRASDLKAKAHTLRKAGKDGPISDAMADSVICLLLGMRLRVTGELQKDNVIELLKTARTVTDRSHHPSFSTDRGYTNKEMIADNSLKKYDVTAICNAAARNTFYPMSVYDDWITKN